MKSFSSGYQRIFRIRKQQKMLAELQVSRASRHCQDLRAQLQELEQSLENLHRELTLALANPETLHAIPASTTLLKNLNLKIQQKRLEMLTAEEQLGKLLSRLKKASEEVQLVDTLLKQSWEEHRSSQRYAEEIELFELSQNHPGREAWS